jgi:hypothetical protein
MFARKAGFVILLSAIGLSFGSQATGAVTLPVYQDFENISQNAYPSANGWHTWLSGASAYVTGLKAYSGIRAFRLNSYSYWSRCDYLDLETVPDRLTYQATLFMDPMAGREAQMGFVQGSGNNIQFYNHFKIFSGDGVTGILQFQGDIGQPPVELGNYAVGQWLTLTAELDFKHRQAALWVGEDLVAEGAPIQPKSFEDPVFGPLVLNRFGVRECNWIGGRLGTIYLDDVVLFETPVRLVEAAVAIDPPRLNLKSKGRVVTCHIELPVDYSPYDIDVTTVRLNELLPAFSKPVVVEDYDYDGVLELMVQFDRRALTDMLSPGEQEITVSGELTDGTPFAGSFMLQVVP